MPTTRRTNGASASLSSDPSTPTATSSYTTTTPAPTHSPYTPTSTERLLLSIYPLTLFLGAAFSHLSPTLRPPYNHSIYSPIAQSFQPDSAAPSYFARKRNVFNVFFVKRGWFWCSLAFLLFGALVARGRPAPNPNRPRSSAQDQDETAKRTERDNRIRRRWQAGLRYVLATTFWILVTQWCFGPPLIDRGFAWTGGVCELAESELASPGTVRGAGKEVASVLTHAACNMAHGTWSGGYDISGHVFILVLGSGMLWMEMLPYLAARWSGLGIGRIVKTEQGKVARVGGVHDELAGVGAGHALRGVNDATQKIQDAAKRELDARPQLHQTVDSTARNARGLKHYAAGMALVTAVLSWWMLLMTAAFFHTWFEKLTGWMLAFGCLWTIYFLPRGSPVIREVLGMPGV